MQTCSRALHDPGEDIPVMLLCGLAVALFPVLVGKYNIGL